MFDNWIKQKQTATDKDIENDFQIPRNTLKKWRINNQGPKVYFRLNDKILYPRVEFVEWFMQHIKNKKATVVPIGSNRTKENISEK